MVIIRLARRGRKNSPAYCVVVADSRTKRNGKFIERLGHYNPTTKTIVLNRERIEVWRNRGATLSEAVSRIAKTRTTRSTKPK